MNYKYKAQEADLADGAGNTRPKDRKAFPRAARVKASNINGQKNSPFDLRVFANGVP